MAAGKKPVARKTAADRLAEKRAKYAGEQLRADGKAVVHKEMIAAAELAFDDQIDRKRERDEKDKLFFTLNRLTIVDLHLSGYSPEEISGILELSESYVVEQLKKIQVVINTRMLSLSENLILVQFARTEHLMRANMPYAIAGDGKATERVLKIMQQQLELQKLLIPPEDEAARDNLEKFQRTITSTNVLYEVAQGNMTEEWLQASNMTVDDLFATVASFEDAAIPEKPKEAADDKSDSSPTTGETT